MYIIAIRYVPNSRKYFYEKRKKANMLQRKSNVCKKSNVLQPNLYLTYVDVRICLVLSSGRVYNNINSQ